jgi:lysozyme
MPIEVIDLSHDDASVDFDAVAQAGIVGVIHKATQGVGDVDPLYAPRARRWLEGAGPCALPGSF